MVLAAAALLFQFASGPAPVNAASSFANVGFHIDGTAQPAAPSAGDSDTKSKSPSTPAVLQPNVDSTRPAANAKDSTTPNLTAMAFGDSQNSQSLSTVRLPELQPLKSSEIASPYKSPSRRNWIVLSLAEHGAAVFDAYSTRQAVSRGAVEMDPLMRPFAHSPAIYAASQVAPVLLDILSRRMMRSENPTARRIWWLPQTINTAVLTFSGIHNLHVANHQQ